MPDRRDVLAFDQRRAFAGGDLRRGCIAGAASLGLPPLDSCVARANLVSDHVDRRAPRLRTAPRQTFQTSVIRVRGTMFERIANCTTRRHCPAAGIEPSDDFGKRAVGLPLVKPTHAGPA